MNKKLTFVFVFIIGLFFIAGPIKAQMYGEGPGPRVQLVIDKKVKPTVENNWRDNLSSSDTVLSAEDLVDFQVKVKNNSEVDLNNIQLTDTLPSYVSLAWGLGSFNKDSKQLTWTVDQLKSGEEKEFLVRAQIDKIGQLPQGKVTCLANKVVGRADNGAEDEDTAQFCFDSRVLATKLPEAGGRVVLGTALALALAGVGFAARKFGRGELLG